MLNACATYCADSILRHRSINSTSRPVLIYGLELTISTLASMTSIIVLSILLNSLTDALLFLLIFMGLRFFCGGYHAKTHGWCFISTNLTFLCVLLFSQGIMQLNIIALPPIIIIIVVVAIIWMAPIRNARHPLSENAYKRNRKIARILVLTLFLLFVIAWYFAFFFKVLSVFSLSMAAVAVLMLIPKLCERRSTRG